MVATGKGTRSANSPNFTGFADTQEREPAAPPSLNAIWGHVDDARTYAATYIAAQIARVRVLLRNAILFGIVAVIAAVVAITVLVYASVMVCSGIAGVIAELCGHRQWAGDLITGLLILGTVFIAAYVVARKIISSARRSTVAEFDRQKIR